MTKSLPKIIPINDELCLKLLMPQDTEQLFSITIKNRSYFAKTISWSKKIMTIDDERLFLENALQKFNSGKAAHYGIHYREEGIIGAIGFNSIDTETKTASLGYWLTPEHQKKGYMDLSLKALINSAKATIQLLYFEIETPEENLPSRKLAERNNFKCDAIPLKDDSKLNERSLLKYRR